jgi:hypothetical protein
MGFAAPMWFRGEGKQQGNLLFDELPKRFPSEERRPQKRARQTLFLKKTYDYLQRQTR